MVGSSTIGCRIEPDFLVLLLAAQALGEHRQRALQIRQQRRVRPRRRQRIEIDVRGQQRLFEQRSARDHSARWIDDGRRAGEPLAAFEPHEVRKRDEDAVLLRNAPDDALPANDRRGQRLALACLILGFAEPARR